MGVMQKEPPKSSSGNPETLNPKPLNHSGPYIRRNRLEAATPGGLAGTEGRVSQRLNPKM